MTTTAKSKNNLENPFFFPIKPTFLHGFPSYSKPILFPTDRFYILLYLYRKKKTSSEILPVKIFNSVQILPDFQ